MDFRAKQDVMIEDTLLLSLLPIVHIFFRITVGSEIGNTLFQETTCLVQYHFESES